MGNGTLSEPFGGVCEKNRVYEAELRPHIARSRRAGGTARSIGAGPNCADNRSLSVGVCDTAITEHRLNEPSHRYGGAERTIRTGR